MHYNDKEIFRSLHFGGSLQHKYLVGIEQRCLRKQRTIEQQSILF